MAALTPELLFPNAWLNLQRVHVLTRTPDGHARLSRSTGNSVKLVYEGQLSDITDHLPTRAHLVTALPLERSLTRILRPPVDSVRTARTLVEGMLDTEVPFALDRARYAFPDFVQSGEKVEALAIAAREQDIVAHLDELTAVQLDPLLLDHEGLAMWTQSLRERSAKKDKRPRIIALCEEGRTALAFGHGRHFLNAVALPHSIDDSAIAGPLDRVLRQLNGSEADWRLAGSKANATSLPDSIASAHIHKRSGTFLERALAQRALKPGPLRMNFRTDHPELHRRRTGRNRRFLLHLLIPGILIWAGSLLWSNRVQARESALQSDLTKTATEIVGHPVPKGQEILLAERALAEGPMAQAPVQRLRNPGAALLLRQALGFARRNNMHIENLAFRNGALVVTGTKVLPLERKLPELRPYRPTLQEDEERYTLTLHLPDAAPGNPAIAGGRP